MYRNGNPPSVRRMLAKDLPPQSPSPERRAAESIHKLRENLTRLRKSQEELAAVRSRAEDRTRYRDLFQFAPNGYVVTDRYAKISDANVAAARLLNLPEGFVTGKPLMLYVPPERRKQIMARLLNIRAGQTIELNVDL